MPGVADKIKRTQDHQAALARRSDMKELVKLVEEGRLHDADEHQLETLKLSLELNDIINKKSTTQLDADAIGDAVAKALEKVVTNLGSSGTIAATSAISDPSRPDMKHVSLSDLHQVEDDVEIVDHGDVLSQAKKGDGSSAAKLAKLKKLQRDDQG